MSARRLVLWVLLLLGGMSVGLLALLAWVLQPDAAIPDLVDRPPPAPTLTRTTAATDSSETFQVSGRVVGADGSPAENVEIEARLDSTGKQHGTFTDEVGSFTLVLEGPSEIRPEDLPSTPWSFPVTGPRDDLRFVVTDLCPLDIQVLDEKEAPIPEARVAARVRVEGFQKRWTRTHDVDADGRVTLEQASCGVADVQAKAEGFVRRRAENVDTMTTKEVTIVLPRGVGLSGQVTNPMNEPLPDARVSAGLASAITNAEGHYDLRFDPDRTSEVSAQAMNYIEQEERLRVAPDMPDLVIDWVLEPSRDLQVFCAGLPDDSCGDVMPLMCTLPWIPFGTLCHTVDNQALCTCPEGKSAVRGGGQSVEVAPGQQVAWLDFRVNGGLEGLVALQGSPLGCEIMAYRLPEDLSDVSRGGIAARRHKCNEEGGFEILGLEPGIYQVDVQVGNHQRRPDPVEVEDTVVDMGVIDLEDGTDVEGTVLDGATGQGAPNETVVAVQSATGGIATGTGFATSRSEGHFVLRGLKDGTWSVFLVSRPFTTVDITITEGTATPDHPTLETGAADLLDENGFGLATDEEGQLVVEGLEPDGAAAEAGLQEGDTIVGVTLMGMDVQGWLPGFGDALVDAVLDHYSGPGVGLVVVRDGEELEVALD